MADFSPQFYFSKINMCRGIVVILGIKVKSTVWYQGIFDVLRAFDELGLTFPEAREWQGRGKSRIVFPIGNDVKVVIARNGIVQVTWTDEKEKIKGLEILENALPPLKGRKKVILKPLFQTPYIKYGQKDIPLYWCDEVTEYFSFDRGLQIKNEYDEMMQDYLVRLDFDSLQKRAEMLYANLPEEWQKQLSPLFEDKPLMRMKSVWAKAFLGEFRKLLWKNSRG